MPSLLAIDVAILLPDAISERAIALSTSLPEDESTGLRLDAAHLPHITLTQQFVRADDLEAVLTRIDDVLRSQAPLRLRATGGVRSRETVWIAIEASAALQDLHARLMDALRDLERPDGTLDAFAGDARDRDVAWVSGYRQHSSMEAFTPHITLGHASSAPHVEPFDFDATTVAACHLGRFCTCRRVLRRWTLTAPAARPGTRSPSA